jgi:hypothetical protein
MTSNHILPSHPRLCSLSVASYDSQGLLWRYSNPPAHRALGNSSSQSQSHIATDGQSVSNSWCQAQIWDIRPEIFFFKFTVLSFWGALSDENSGLSCVSIVIEFYHSIVY